MGHIVLLERITFLIFFMMHARLATTVRQASVLPRLVPVGLTTCILGKIVLPVASLLQKGTTLFKGPLPSPACVFRDTIVLQDLLPQHKSPALLDTTDLTMGEGTSQTALFVLLEGTARKVPQTHSHVQEDTIALLVFPIQSLVGFGHMETRLVLGEVMTAQIVSQVTFAMGWGCRNRVALVILGTTVFRAHTRQLQIHLWTM